MDLTVTKDRMDLLINSKDATIAVLKKNPKTKKFVEFLEGIAKKTTDRHAYFFIPEADWKLFAEVMDKLRHPEEIERRRRKFSKEEIVKMKIWHDIIKKNGLYFDTFVTLYFTRYVDLKRDMLITKGLIEKLIEDMRFFNLLEMTPRVYIRVLGCVDIYTNNKGKFWREEAFAPFCSPNKGSQMIWKFLEVIKLEAKRNKADNEFLNKIDDFLQKGEERILYLKESRISYLEENGNYDEGDEWLYAYNNILEQGIVPALLLVKKIQSKVVSSDMQDDSVGETKSSLRESIESSVSSRETL